MVHYKKVKTLKSAKARRRFRKRWSVAAGVGFGPYRANVKFNSRSVKPSTVKKIAKREIHKAENPMHLDNQQLSFSLLQNTIYSFNPLASILNTTGNVSQDGYRTSDHIFVDAAKVSISIATTSNTPSDYRLMLVKSGADLGGTSTTFGSMLGSSDIFRTFDSQHSTLSLINSQVCTKIMDERISLPIQPQAGTFKMVVKDYIIPIKSRFDYKGPTSSYGKFKNFYFVLFGYTPTGVTGTTPLGVVNWNMDLIYKNSI